MSTKYPELPVATQTAMKPPDDEALLRPVPAAFSQTPVCRTETGISPDGINAFSQLIGHLPAVGLFVVLLALAIVILRTGRVVAGRRKTADMQYGKPAPVALTFGSREMAVRAAEDQNAAYWQSLLSAFRDALDEEGYELRRTAHDKVVLSPDARKRVGATIVRARERYISPSRRGEVLEQILQQAADDGYTESWADWCCQAAESTGWYIAPGEKKPAGTRENLTDWQKNAYPLRQVTVKVFTSERWQLTRDMVRCLSDIAAIVREKSFPEDEEGKQYTGNSLTSDMQYSIQWRICWQPPGFFPDAAGTHIPPSLHVDDSVSVGSAEHELTLFVQGTRHTSPEYLADFIEVAGNRIGEGEIRGARYDDDSGFAFFVNSRLTSRVAGVPAAVPENPTLSSTSSAH
ncbi:hypothetical protein DFO55_11819 [Grimontella sp. AG753]|nr:hypothetical protein DFO55_11819 [Grimontella sp. AG753]